MKKQKNMFQTKQQDKIPEIDLHEMEVSDLPDKEFKIMVTKMLAMIRRPVCEQSDNFNKKR